MVGKVTWAIFYGEPNSGKGTQAAIFAPKGAEGALQLSSGDILRDRRIHDPLFDRVYGPTMDTGGLLDKSVVLESIMHRLDQWSPEKRLIMDGFPRTDEQFGPIWQCFVDHGVQQRVAVVHFTGANPEVLCERAGVRGRVDDSREVVINRIRLFRLEHERLMAKFRQHMSIIEIDASRPKEAVTAQIVAQVGWQPILTSC